MEQVARCSEEVLLWDTRFGTNMKVYKHKSKIGKLSLEPKDDYVLLGDFEEGEEIIVEYEVDGMNDAYSFKIIDGKIEIFF